MLKVPKRLRLVVLCINEVAVVVVDILYPNPPGPGARARTPRCPRPTHEGTQNT